MSCFTRVTYSGGSATQTCGIAARAAEEISGEFDVNTPEGVLADDLWGALRAVRETLEQITSDLDPVTVLKRAEREKETA